MVSKEISRILWTQIINYIFVTKVNYCLKSSSDKLLAFSKLCFFTQIVIDSGTVFSFINISLTNPDFAGMVTKKWL